MQLPKKENKNIEFKSKLSKEIHLKESRFEHLVTQMKYLLEIGNGYCIYIIGVDDNGNPIGISGYEFEESIQVLKEIAEENDAEIYKIEKFYDENRLIGKVIIKRKDLEKKLSFINIGIGGHVHHGKSTLIATLITGRKDLDGKNWLFLNVLPHEIERRLTADLHYTFLAFKNNEPLIFKNPLDKKEKAEIIKNADKIVNFIDNVGHDGWIYSSIRGIIGQNLDYGIIVVAADDGITHITKEHLGIMLSINLPIIVCLTKIDLVNEEKLEKRINEVEQLLKNIGRIPFVLREDKDIKIAIENLPSLVPIILTSSKTKEGFDKLYKLLSKLSENKKDDESESFLMYIDKVYKIEGVGCVVSGSIKRGSVKVNDELFIGPFKDGSFKKVRVSSIETHYCRISEADSGYIVGIAIKGVNSEEVRRGMVLASKDLKLKPYRGFEAEIIVLTNPTKISNGYEPVVHINTLSEAAKIEILDKEYLKSGERGRVRFYFKYNPYYIEENEKFVFREGRTKGIGTILKVF